MLRDGRQVELEDIRIATTRQPVYNFSVAELSCYAVGPMQVLVHINCKPEGASAVSLIGGRKPINSEYAGQTHPSGVKFNAKGFPDFSQTAKAQVMINGLTENYAKDAVMANQAIGLTKTPSGYVWHHVEDGSTMQLIPQIVHNKVRHTGGDAVIRHGG